MNRPDPVPTSGAPAAAASPVEMEVRRIRALFEGGRYVESAAAAETLAVQVPENRDVLYLSAISQRFLKKIPEALAILERLERHHPRYSRVHQERGNCFVAYKDARRAIDAFLIAVNMNTALPQSWAMLESLYRMTGDGANASMAAAHVATLKRLPAEIVAATAFFSDGDLSAAEGIVRAYLLAHGDHVEAMRLLARIGIERQVFDDAEVLLEAVLQLAPDYRAARYDYARALLERHKHLRAREELETLLKLDPSSRQYRTLYATVCVGLGEQAKSIGLYRELLLEMPDALDLRMSLAHCLKTLGQREEAVAAYRDVTRAKADYGDAYWSLANLKTYRFSGDDLERMRAAEVAPGTTPVDRYHLCFALGKGLEDGGNYEESFRHYERGNALKREESRYRPEMMELNTRLQKEICSREFFDERAGVGHPSADPIFIVGLPRSGSTLIEQILASHSRVEGTQELAEIPRMALELQGRDPEVGNPRYPAALGRLPLADFERMGARYLGDTRIYRTDTPHFIDKMPNNFRHLGLIHLILPNAKIIDARREPMACCFSNFKQLFAAGQEFTYSISDIARYYRTYLELMTHWDRVLPGKVLRLHHEDVVEDLEGSVRRLLDFCGLEFEAACVDFYKTERSVRTASSEQVRQPIFRDGLDQWRKFEPWLEPLRLELGDALSAYRQ